MAGIYIFFCFEYIFPLFNFAFILAKAGVLEAQYNLGNSLANYARKFKVR